MGNGMEHPPCSINGECEVEVLGWVAQARGGKGPHPAPPRPLMHTGGVSCVLALPLPLPNVCLQCHQRW